MTKSSEDFPAFMSVTCHPASFEDPIATAEWSQPNDCLVIKLGVNACLFMRRDQAQEFARRVQAAVAVGFPPMDEPDKLPVGLWGILSSPAEKEGAE